MRESRRPAPASPPAKLPPIPETRDDLLIAALRHADMVSRLLNALSAEVFRLAEAEPHSARYSRLQTLLRERLFEHSGTFLFVGAELAGVDLPADLRGGRNGEVRDGE